MRRTHRATGVAILLALFTGTSQADERLVVGLLTNPAGPYAGIRTAVREAAEVGRRESEARYGISIRVRAVDVGLEPKAAALTLANLAIVEKEAAVVAFVAPSSAALFSNVAAEFKVPLLIAGGIVDMDRAGQARKYLFQLTPTSMTEGRALAWYVNETKQGRPVWIVAQDTGTSYERAWGFRKELTALGWGGPVTYAPVSPGERDFMSVLRKIAASQRPVVYLDLSGEQVERWVQQSRSLVGTQGVDVLIPESRREEGVKAGLIAAYGGAVLTLLPFPLAQSQENRAFVDKYRARENMPPPPESFVAYNAVAILAQAAKQGRGRQAEQLIASLEQFEFNTLWGPVRFRPETRQFVMPLGVSRVSEAGAATFYQHVPVRVIPRDVVDRLSR
ncbi:MAG: ABC transporter substrate-binding protein [Chloroflexi bacterium]|nr:ABC transporter substrate-binding protein [Chloroflexota bacterium]